MNLHPRVHALGRVSESPLQHQYTALATVYKFVAYDNKTHGHFCCINAILHMSPLNFQMITMCSSIRHSDCGFPVTVTSGKLACFS